MRTPAHLSRPLQVVAALALGLSPGTALANPGPDPEAELIFFGISVGQIVLGTIAVGALRGPSSSLAAYLAIVLAFLGLSSVMVWEASLLFQAPAALFLLMAFAHTDNPSLKFAGLLATALTLAFGGYAIDHAIHPRSRLFSSSAHSLGGESVPATTPPKRPTHIKDFGPPPSLSADGGMTDAGALTP